MKTVLDKDGNFMFTFEGEDIDVSGDEYEDCTIVEGDQPMTDFIQEQEDEEANFASGDDHDHEAEVEDMLQRIIALEQKVADLENNND